jgi:hypothetical protein
MFSRTVTAANDRAIRRTLETAGVELASVMRAEEASAGLAKLRRERLECDLRTFGDDG